MVITTFRSRFSIKKKKKVVAVMTLFRTVSIWLFCKRQLTILFWNVSGFILSVYNLTLRFAITAFLNDASPSSNSIPDGMLARIVGLHVRVVSVFGKIPTGCVCVVFFAYFWAVFITPFIPQDPPLVGITFILSNNFFFSCVGFVRNPSKRRVKLHLKSVLHSAVFSIFI